MPKIEVGQPEFWRSERTNGVIMTRTATPYLVRVVKQDKRSRSYFPFQDVERGLRVTISIGKEKSKLFKSFKQFGRLWFVSESKFFCQGGKIFPMFGRIANYKNN